MKNDMNLWHDSFTAIREQTKTIEMRLYDEKRSKIKIGDSIIFTDTSNLVDMFPLTRMVETVCLLSKLHEAKHHVSVKPDMDEYYEIVDKEASDGE